MLTENVARIDKAIGDMLFYSYQYNLKIVGVPHVGETESSEETVELCVKLFSALGFRNTNFLYRHCTQGPSMK